MGELTQEFAGQIVVESEASGGEEALGIQAANSKWPINFGAEHQPALFHLCFDDDEFGIGRPIVTGVCESGIAQSNGRIVRLSFTPEVVRDLMDAAYISGINHASQQFTRAMTQGLKQTSPVVYATVEGGLKSFT